MFDVADYIGGCNGRRIRSECGAFSTSSDLVFMLGGRAHGCCVSCLSLTVEMLDGFSILHGSAPISKCFPHRILNRVPYSLCLAVTPVHHDRWLGLTKMEPERCRRISIKTIPARAAYMFIACVCEGRSVVRVYMFSTSV